MSKLSKPLSKPKANSQVHGTVKSYVTGFVLSLVFTLIPYYLVVAKSLTGNALLGVIIAFAVVQLVIQVVFFLHLGREPKPRWNLLFFLSTISIILLVVVGSIWIMSHLQHQMSATDVTNKISTDEAVHEVNGVQTGTCPGGTGSVHMIELKNDAASPRHTDARLCDTIIITNTDDTARDIEFGVHDLHETYAGEMGQTLRPGRNMVLTLTELGTHKFHDHLLDNISGDFTVTP
jgi:cytochrome o ubiquinol oxidase operon protein cyoD